ncbi:MAG TPA: hypothetical protein VLL05_05990 [Terriglobales bacterium]|nr:hypothetical protein [Terriglobales bacterium]
MQEMIAARVVEGSAYEDLVTGGFAPGYTFRCHACEVSYRLYYRAFGGAASVTQQAAEIPAFETCVENSHPAHPDRIWVKRIL